MAAGKVFISHCVKDHGDVRDLVTHLEARGISVWIAPRDVRPGQDYSEQIEEAIEQCSAFVVIVTEAANASLFVRAETEMAFSSRRPIFPVRFRDLEPAKGLRLFLNIHHWTNVFGAESPQNLERLAAELAALSGAAAAPPAAPPAIAPERPIVAPPPKRPASEAGRPLLTRPRAAMAGAAALLLSLSLAWPLVSNGGGAAAAVEEPASLNRVPDPGGIGHAAAQSIGGQKPTPRTAAPAPARSAPVAASAERRAAAPRRPRAMPLAASSTRRTARVPASTPPVSAPPVRMQMRCRQFTVRSGESSDRNRACVSSDGRVLMM